MTKVLLYDNSSFVPQDISNLLGVSRFSDIYYRKRSLDRWVSDICTAAGIQFIEIEGGRGSRDIVKHLGLSGQKNLVVMYMPSFFAFGCSEEDAVIFLRKLSLTRSSLLVSPEPEHTTERLKIAVAVSDLAQLMLQAVSDGDDVGELLADVKSSMHPVADDVGMIDMRDPLHFTDYLTSNFDARFFFFF